MLVIERFSWLARWSVLATRVATSHLGGVRGIVDGYGAKLAADVAATCG